MAETLLCKGSWALGTACGRCPRCKRSPQRTQDQTMDDSYILAGAKFYARAVATRAVSGVIPEWDDEADDANWRRTRPDVRSGCLDMVRGIVAAAGFRLAQAPTGRASAARRATDRTGLSSSEVGNPKGGRQTRHSDPRSRKRQNFQPVNPTFGE